MKVTRKINGAWVSAELPKTMRVLVENNTPSVDADSGVEVGFYQSTSVVLCDEEDNTEEGDFCIMVGQEGFVQGGGNTHWNGIYVRPTGFSRVELQLNSICQ